MRKQHSATAESPRPRRRRTRRLCLLATALYAGLCLAPMAPAEAGFAEGMDAYDAGDYGSALLEFLPLARAGNMYAQFMVGRMHDEGRGMPENDAEARRWYRLAAEQGNADAQLYLGFMYDFGEGVPENKGEAVKWYRRAAEQGHVDAQFNLAFMYDSGEGIPENDLEAVKWYRRAADQGHSSAQFCLGVMYDIGEGVPENDAEAAGWYRRAAEQGDADAQLNLGFLYARGEGVPEDLIQAHLWFSLAAVNFEPGTDRDRAVEYRDRAETMLSPIQVARAQALARGWRPKTEAGASRVPAPAEPAAQPIPSASYQVREAQSLLGVIGFDPGPVDGILGQQTRAAIRRFQQLAGLGVDGEVTELLVAALRFAVAIQSEPTAIAPERTLAATGSGFAVTLDGLVLTNEHVVAGCGELRVRPPEGGLTRHASLEALDPTNDLALLRAPSSFAASAVFREGRGIRAGDGVVVVGYPLRGLLADEAGVTTGSVSALAGLGNDARYLQLTAPVQPGNSGGPLVDMGGRVVGVVVAKLNALRIADATGDIPQNVNFALKSAIARGFLDAQNVDYASAPPAEPLAAADVGARTKSYTVLVECWR